MSTKLLFIASLKVIGFAGLYVGPYLSQSCANFYNDLINDNLIETTDPDEKNQETTEDKLTESHEPEKEE